MRRTARLVPTLTLAAGSALLPAAFAHGASAAAAPGAAVAHGSSAAGPHGAGAARSASRPAARAAAVKAAPEPVGKEAAETRSEQRAVSRYWTGAKMESAKPLDVPAPRKEGVRLTAAATAEQAAADPVEVPATRPGGGTVTPAASAARTSSGAAWTRGGTVAKTAGRVFFTYQGRNASCSATAVTGGNRSTVITAGHCVRMGGAFHTNWVFVPGYANGERPYGTWVATALYTTPQWNNGEDVNYDVAAAVVAPLEGRSLTDVVGGQGVSFNQPRRQRMHAFGYPAAAPYDGSSLTYCAGQTFDDFMMSRDLGLNCTMNGGSSGGPWFAGFDENTGLGTVNSVNSFKYGFAGGWMFGPYFGAEARDVYEAAQEAATPIDRK
ncbi:trypsin-like serine peptidase [Streptosporangium sp. NPDC004379]|uniref:trypsin-like serine peptidase n=1 Tax=Streptosporangium sp. NPDC004379 TaxID=3366189 RepID=UPI0036844EAA